MKNRGYLLVMAGILMGQAGERPPGSPLEGITAGDFERFRIGLEDFTEVETVGDGLGPAFNATGCSQCHNLPAIGGMGTITEVRAGRRDADGTFHVLDGGTLFHLFSTPPHNCQARIPPEANVIARRMSMPLFGAGLVEAIADETIVALEDPEDRDGDGIRGRAARIFDVATKRERIGRFGWKAQQATLLAFAGDAYRNEMGITNDLFPEEVALGVDPQKLRLCDPASDPEDVRNRVTGLRGIDKFESFMKFLAPVGRGAVGEKEQQGERVFGEMGCGGCHVPALRTGPNTNPVFDRKAVPLYSDLLLHNVGTGDGIEQGAATGEEIRTPALWGLRFRRPFLHDGSAATLDDAVRRHEAEAARSGQRYSGAAEGEREALLAFLRSM